MRATFERIMPDLWKQEPGVLLFAFLFILVAFYSLSFYYVQVLQQNLPVTPAQGAPASAGATQTAPVPQPLSPDGTSVRTTLDMI